MIRLFGEIFLLFFPTAIQPGWFAVAGAAALLSGVTRTISAIVIIFEVTGQLFLLIPTTVAVVVAYYTASLFAPPIYDLMIKLKGIILFV